MCHGAKTMPLHFQMLWRIYRVALAVIIPAAAEREPSTSPRVNFAFGTKWMRRDLSPLPSTLGIAMNMSRVNDGDIA